jgi:membrane protease YdiL (CAAX protease family)
MGFKGIYANKSSASKVGILFLLIFVSFILHIIIATGLVYLFADNGLALIQQQDLSNQAFVNYLKLMQLFTAVGLFITPTLLYAYLCNFDLRLRLNFSRQTLLLAIAIMLLINPFISFLYEWNMSFNLPDWLIAYDLKAEQMTKSFMRMNSLPDLGFNLLVLAIVPAIGEELLFRGYLQQKCEKWLGKPQLAIIITAILFSAIHLQFQGFLPRFILGLVLGYFMYWSGSLWLPIIAHFCNNAMAVIFVYPALSDYAYLAENTATWQEAFFSFMAVGLLAFLLQKSINIKKG